MKKLVILSAATVLFAYTSNAQDEVSSANKGDKTAAKQENVTKYQKKEEREQLRKLNGDEVSDRAKEQFMIDFGHVPVTKWERTAHYDEATFNQDGQVMKAYYDAEFNLVGTTVHKAFSDLPAKAQKNIDARYQGYTKADVILFDDNEHNDTDMEMFGSQFADEDNYFVVLKKENKEIILQVNMSGDVSFFKQVK